MLGVPGVWCSAVQYGYTTTPHRTAPKAIRIGPKVINLNYTIFMLLFSDSDSRTRTHGLGLTDSDPRKHTKLYYI